LSTANADRLSSLGRTTVDPAPLRADVFFTGQAASTPPRNSLVAAASAAVWTPHESSSNLQQTNSVDRSSGWLLDDRSWTCR